MNGDRLDLGEKMRKKFFATLRGSVQRFTLPQSHVQTPVRKTQDPPSTKRTFDQTYRFTQTVAEGIFNNQNYPDINLNYKTYRKINEVRKSVPVKQNQTDRKKLKVVQKQPSIKIEVEEEDPLISTSKRIVQEKIKKRNISLIEFNQKLKKNLNLKQNLHENLDQFDEMNSVKEQAQASVQGNIFLMNKMKTKGGTIQKKNQAINQTRDLKRYDKIIADINLIVFNLNEIGFTNNCHRFNLLMIEQLNYAPEIYFKVLVQENGQRLRSGITFCFYIKRLCELKDKENFKLQQNLQRLQENPKLQSDMIEYIKVLQKDPNFQIEMDQMIKITQIVYDKKKTYDCEQLLEQFGNHYKGYKEKQYEILQKYQKSQKYKQLIKLRDSLNYFNNNDIENPFLTNDLDTSRNINLASFSSKCKYKQVQKLKQDFLNKKNQINMQSNQL